MDQLDKHIRSYDPALDAISPDGVLREWFIEWVKSRKGDVVCKPGATPDVFYAVRLRNRALLWVHEVSSLEDRRIRAFRCGVRRWESADRSFRPAGVDEQTYRAMTEDELERFEWADIQEIGSLILERATLPSCCEVGYALPPTSQRGLEGRLAASLRAAPSQATPAPTASAPEGS